jgi:predicted dehydrogenase
MRAKVFESSPAAETSIHTMHEHFNRRLFLKRTALSAGALVTGPFLAGPNVLAAAGGERVRCVVIGCGGRGMSHLGATVNEELVAIVDPDEQRHAAAQKWLTGKGKDASKVRTFTDYRRMFDAVGKQIDAVFIATPNHHHALPAMLGMNLGKGVYCEKPLCHTVAEARRLRAMAKESKAPTQMGNQGHCEDGYRRLVECIGAGLIGNVTETHSWTDRANGGEGPRPPSQPTPKGLHWDEWIGPAPYRDYHDDLHPHEWHGWYDFGNGSIGNSGCHVLDGVFWALNVEHPVGIEMEEVRGGTAERCPVGSRLRWDVPPRGDLPALKVYWYDGLNRTTQAKPEGTLRRAEGDALNVPALYHELRKQYPDEEFGGNGTLYVGDKGILYTGSYGDRFRLVPQEKMKATPLPPKRLPRPRDIFTDFLTACRTGQRETAAGFDYATRLTEFTLLGNLAQRAGPHKPVQWDGPGMKVINIQELNRWVSVEPRKGWQA